MTAPGNFGRSMSAAAGRGAVLVGAAILLGVVLLAFGLDKADDTAATTPPAPTDTTPTSVLGDTQAPPTTGANGEVSPVETPTTSAPVDTGADVAHAPNEVLVMTANGSGTSGEAGRLATALGAANFRTDAANASDTSTSKIYFRDTYAADAQAVATLLGAPASIIQRMPENPALATDADTPARAAAAHIIVIIGSDGVFP